VELMEKVLGREHPSTLSSMGNLASVLDIQGKYDEAEQMPDVGDDELRDLILCIGHAGKL
jgi:hypothetical protein